MESKIFVILLLVVGGISIGITYALSDLPSTGYPDNVTIGQTKKFYLDGGNNTYISNSVSGNDRIDIVSGGTTVLQLKHSYVAPNVDLLLSQGQKFAFDGTGTSTYEEAGSNTLLFYTNGVQALIIGSDQSLTLQQGKKFYLDGGTNNYVSSPASNQVAIFSGGTQTVTANNGNVGIGTSNPTQKLDIRGNLNMTGNLTSAASKELKITAPTGIPICIGTGC